MLKGQRYDPTGEPVMRSGCNLRSRGRLPGALRANAGRRQPARYDLSSCSEYGRAVAPTRGASHLDQIIASKVLRASTWRRGIGAGEPPPCGAQRHHPLVFEVAAAPLLISQLVIATQNYLKRQNRTLRLFL
jgi:hypothetical protein